MQLTLLASAGVAWAVSIPQAVITQLQPKEMRRIVEPEFQFQYRKRYYPVATGMKNGKNHLFSSTEFQYRKRYYPVATRMRPSWIGEKNPSSFNTASGNTQLQLKILQTTPAPTARFNTASGMAQLQQCSNNLDESAARRRRVSIPQAVLPSCNGKAEARGYFLQLFQYRKRYYPVATQHTMIIRLN